MKGFVFERNWLAKNSLKLLIDYCYWIGNYRKENERQKNTAEPDQPGGGGMQCCGEKRYQKENNNWKSEGMLKSVVNSYVSTTRSAS